MQGKPVVSIRNQRQPIPAKHREASGFLRPLARSFHEIFGLSRKACGEGEGAFCPIQYIKMISGGPSLQKFPDLG